MKVLPIPYSDSTDILPFIFSTNRLVMARPRPVPTTLRFFLLSTLSKLANILSRSSLCIPIPVSFILKIRSAVFSSSEILPLTDNVTVPSFVYLKALDKILIRICFIRFSSPKSVPGSFGSTFTISFTSLFCALFLAVII